MTMKILYICSDSGIPILGRKGASVHVRSLVSAFTRAGHSVVVATPLLTKSPWEPPASLDAQILHVPASEATVGSVDAVRSYNDALGAANTLPGELRRILYNQQLEAKLLRRFKDDPPDFVYERAAVFSRAGVTVARALGVPLVVELNAPLALEQATYRGSHLPELAGQAERATLAGADVVLTVSAPLRNYVIGQGVAPERVEVMPNGIDTDLFAPAVASEAVRARWGIGPGPVLGFVGGLRPWHGVRAFPELVEGLVARHPRLQIVIAGDGPLRQELSAAFADRRLTGHVVFAGTVAHEDIPDLVRLFDIALAPYDESDHLFYFSPLKLFEYMGCGVPVVAAALGQIADVIRHDENGVLYSPGDHAGLADACERLLDDPLLRQRLGRAAAEAVHRRFTWRQNARRIVELVQHARNDMEVAV
jgi:glycosyltransferase involved in cell wall biosynthesis